jgi:hypothetical protein
MFLAIPPEADGVPPYALTLTPYEEHEGAPRNRILIESASFSRFVGAVLAETRQWEELSLKKNLMQPDKCFLKPAGAVALLHK